MSSIAEKSEPVESEHPVVRKSWKLGVTGWILILGLVALNIGVLFEAIDWNKQTLGWILYRIDPRYWPLWPIPILWGVVAWQFNNVLKIRSHWIARRQIRIKLGILLVTLCWMTWLGGWTLLYIRRRIYNQIYVAYIMGPISIYIADGTWSWKLLILPTLAVLTIGSLLYVAYQQRRKNHESKSRIEKSGEPAE